MTRHDGHLNCKKAFTLVELLLASAILVFAVSGLLALFCNALALNETNRNKYAAFLHNEMVMEEIKNMPFANISAAIQNGTWNWNTSVLTGRGLVPLASEQINTTVNGTTVLNISVTSSWLDRGSRVRNLTLMTQVVSP